jgi:hypothetical protein
MLYNMKHPVSCPEGPSMAEFEAEFEPASPGDLAELYRDARQLADRVATGEFPPGVSGQRQSISDGVDIISCRRGAANNLLLCQRDRETRIVETGRYPDDPTGESYEKRVVVFDNSCLKPGTLERSILDKNGVGARGSAMSTTLDKATCEQLRADFSSYIIGEPVPEQEQ